MKTTFFISDTHFGHANIIKHEPVLRPFKTIDEHDEELVKRWNAKVKPRDIVWHLGDVLFTDESFDLLPRLNGIKKLVLGNHDDYPVRHYMEHFDFIYGVTVFQKYVLTHIPVDIHQSKRFKGNIHGHLHGESLNTGFHQCVSVEQTALEPIAFEELFAENKAFSF